MNREQFTAFVDQLTAPYAGNVLNCEPTGEDLMVSFLQNREMFLAYWEAHQDDQDFMLKQLERMRVFESPDEDEFVPAIVRCIAEHSERGSRFADMMSLLRPKDFGILQPAEAARWILVAHSVRDPEVAEQAEQELARWAKKLFCSNGTGRLLASLWYASAELKRGHLKEGSGSADEWINACERVFQEYQPYARQF